MNKDLYEIIEQSAEKQKAQPQANSKDLSNLANELTQYLESRKKKSHN